MQQSFNIIKDRPVCIQQSEIQQLLNSYTNSFQRQPFFDKETPEELIFLRELVSKGQWNYVEEMLLPLKDRPGHTQCLYLIYHQYYIELLMGEYSGKEDLLREVLVKLREVCSSKDEFSSLCYLLTLPSLLKHPDYTNWSVMSSRELLYNQLLQFLYQHIYLTKSPSPTTPPLNQGGRLVQLLARGLLYEQCEDIFLKRHGLKPIPTDHMLDLLTWLQQLPDSLFQTPPTALPIKITPPLVKSTNHISQSMLLTDNAQEQPQTPPLSISAPELLENNERCPNPNQVLTPPTHTDKSGPSSSTPKYPMSRQPLLSSPPTPILQEKSRVKFDLVSVQPKLSPISVITDKQVCCCRETTL